MLHHLFEEGEDPFPRYKNFFNIYRLDVVSAESGADNPGTGTFRNTALDATYYGDGVNERLLVVNQSKAFAELLPLYLMNAVPEIRFVSVNDTRYGGSGGFFTVFAGGNVDGERVGLHELGHSFAQLADEYVSILGLYTGPEPFAPNVTKDPSGAKWSHWLGYEDFGVFPIDAYEGAGFYSHGLYRPSFESKMREIYYRFDPIAREAIILQIYQFVDPLDGWLSNADPLTDSDRLWIDPIDPNVIHAQWFVDGELVDGFTDFAFNLLDAGFGLGQYNVVARAYDPTGFDPVDGWVRIHTDRLEQFVSWTVNVTVVPEPSGLALCALAVLAAAPACVRRRRRS